MHGSTENHFATWSLCLNIFSIIITILSLVILF